MVHLSFAAPEWIGWKRCKSFIHSLPFVFLYWYVWYGMHGMVRYGLVRYGLVFTGMDLLYHYQ